MVFNKGVHIAQPGFLAVGIKRTGLLEIIGRRRGVEWLFQIIGRQHAGHGMRRCGQPGVGGLVDAVGFDLVDKQGVGRGGQDIDGGEHQQDLGLHAPFFAVFHLPFPCVGGHADAHAGWEV